MSIYVYDLQVYSLRYIILYIEIVTMHWPISELLYCSSCGITSFCTGDNCSVLYRSNVWTAKTC